MNEKICGDIVFEHVKKQYGKNVVVPDLNLTIRSGERTILLGPSGCGKTTTLRMISGLEDITSGKLYMGDTLANDIPSGDRNIAMVFQNILLFPWLTVMQNVEYSLQVRGIDKTTRRAEAQKYIELVGLKGFEHSYPLRISGGMKQRVGIARAYCTKPDVMLMDEPFGALDAQTRYLMQDEVVRISNQEKRTVIFVTNNVEEAVYLADRIIVMTDSPSTVLKDVRVDLPRPRSYVDPEFLRLRKEISAMVNRKR